MPPNIREVLGIISDSSWISYCKEKLKRVRYNTLVLFTPPQAFNSLSMHWIHKTIVSFPTSFG
jgi:hypothetical protein